jgi:hypothetical protein
MSTKPTPSSVAAAVDRMAVPVLVFGMVFALAMGALTYLASPDRFPVRIGDKVVKVQDLADEERALKEREAKLLQARKELDALVPTPVLQEIEGLRAGNTDVGHAFKAVEAARKSFSLADDSPVTVTRTWYSRAEGRLAIGGEVRDPAGRSMHILASFVDNLRESGVFEKVSEPEYVQTEADGVVTSPFAISLTLPHGR